jgi:hypothetical protein
MPLSLFRAGSVREVGFLGATLHETQALQEGENVVQWMYLLIDTWTLTLPLQSSQVVTEATTKGSDTSSLQPIDVHNDHS